MFTGYCDKTLDFLWGIRLNNDRAWFTEHKDDYLQYLRYIGVSSKMRLPENSCS